MKEFLVIALYLWVVFALLAVHKTVILGEHHIDFAAHGFALINALALGKVVLVGRKLHLADDLLPNAPLIYPAMLKSAVFTVLLAGFKILEDAGLGLYHGQSFSQSIADIGGGTWKGILSISAIMFVVLIPFFAFTELQKIVGEGKLERMFFYTRQPLNLPGRLTETLSPPFQRQSASKEAAA
ncbi:MAG: hypothetical protein JO319_00815 [Acidobacteriaceae bacterium]|nr:hypothetical protein [Acidobacteriaceae bacterium]